jgi:hypothetical protein
MFYMCMRVCIVFFFSYVYVCMHVLHARHLDTLCMCMCMYMCVYI